MKCELLFFNPLIGAAFMDQPFSQSHPRAGSDHLADHITAVHKENHIQIAPDPLFRPYEPAGELFIGPIRYDL